MKLDKDKTDVWNKFFWAEQAHWIQNKYSLLEATDANAYLPDFEITGVKSKIVKLHYSQTSIGRLFDVKPNENSHEYFNSRKLKFDPA